MKKVLYMTNLPVPYKLDFFEELGKYVDLTVVFERKAAANRDSDWLSAKTSGFNAVFLKGRMSGNENAFCPGICGLIKKGHYDEIVASVYQSPTEMIATQYMRKKRIPYFISSDGGFIKPDSKLKKNIKSYFMVGAKGYFSPSAKTDEYLVHYKANRKRIHRYPFTSIKEKDVLEKCIEKEEKEIIKKELNIMEEKIVLGVGQFIPRKGWDVLIKAASKLPENIGIYIIGGKPTQEYLDMKKKLRLTHLHFIDFKMKTILKQYYLSADVFVLPTREDIWGLVINEAMGCGLPVITTDRCMAGLEMIHNGENGFIVPVDDAKALCEKIQIILNNTDLRYRMGSESLKTIRKFTIEEMATIYASILVGTASMEEI